MDAFGQGRLVGLVHRFARKAHDPGGTRP
jgi:hypothetical protein